MAKTYECAGCGEECVGVTAHLVHVTNCTVLKEGGGTITRTVSCFRCAGDIDPRKGMTCDACGFTHPGFTNPNPERNHR